MDLSYQEGEYLVKLVRQAIETYFDTQKVLGRPEVFPEIFEEKRGVFVTLNVYPDKRLRGCIGYPLAYEPLIDGVISSAVSAAFSDPRFAPLKKSELDNIVVEVTVLSPMIVLDKNREYKSQIKVGRDGLFIICGANSGLLLPQVPVEWNWDEDEFLREICIKAGLSEDCYRYDSCELYRFTGQIFEEIEPYGKIVEKNI
jgi:uncharacterized protein (TIGR00296 family)